MSTKIIPHRTAPALPALIAGAGGAGLVALRRVLYRQHTQGVADALALDTSRCRAYREGHGCDPHQTGT